ncbi:MAG: PAS domain-containing sensor histidine kinase [FCB group bacterium]|nr:PAS domain-containing sensor histidine kinase [FCB group bacterium]
MEKLKRKDKDTLEFLPGALIEIDFSRQVVTYMNRMAYFLFGCDSSAVDAGIPLHDIFLNKDEFQKAKGITESFGLESYTKKTPYTRFEKQDVHDFWFKKEDGGNFCGACQGSFILDADQIPVGVRLYIRDLTEQKSTEVALQESEEKYRTLVEYSTDLIFLVDKSENVISVNQAAAKSIGRKPDEIQGKNIGELFPTEIAKTYRISLKKVFLTGESANYETTLGSGSHQVWINTSLNAIRDSQGQVSAVMGVSRDITEHKLAAIKIKESDRLRELLLDVVTHDLKTPVSVIYGLADMAREYLPDDEVIESIYLSSQRLISVLENTSILSRAVFGEQIPKSNIGLAKMIEEIGSEFASQLENNGMVLELSVPKNIHINANPLIGEVFKNYISNAIKYARDGQKIIVEAIEENGSVMIGVKDFGPTIPADKRSLIFERGTQLSSSKKTGRGLGLAIVKRIARAHDGDVGVEANEPRGNIFYLRLPQ